MDNRKMTVVQCWDDGVTTDIRLVKILRKHNTKATFNLNAGLTDAAGKGGWTFKGTKVERLGWDGMKELYQGFTITNHSLTHPHLEQLSPGAALKDIVEGRDRLQQFFNQPILGFAYPFGTYNEEAMAAVRKAGHIYARTTRYADNIFPPENAMAFHSNCHFLAPDFFDKYERAKKHGLFYFWGHSYEMITEEMWAGFEATIKRISADPESRWGDVAEVFEK